MRHLIAVTTALVAGLGAAQAAPVYTSQVTVPYGTTSSVTQSNTTAYTVYFGTDATNVYVDVVAANPAASAGNFSNIYLGGTFGGLGIEVANHQAFKPGTAGYYDLTNTGFTYTVLPGDISFSLPLSFLETDPLGIGFSPRVKTGDLLRISYSQSFGYNMVGGPNYTPDPVGRLGSFIVPPLAAAVPEPASIALLGAGLLGLAACRRRRPG